MRQTTKNGTEESLSTYVQVSSTDLCELILPSSIGNRENKENRKASSNALKKIKIKIVKIPELAEFQAYFI